MESLNTILDYIARTNLFNFAIFAGIIIYLIVKLKVNDRLEDAKISVKESITESENTRVVSEEKLNNIKEDMETLGDKVDAIINESRQNAQLVGEKIIEEAKKSALVIRDNAGKTIENDRVLLKNDLIKRASLASVEVARDKIKEELNRNSELHEKIINECIDALEEINQK